MDELLPLLVKIQGPASYVAALALVAWAEKRMRPLVLLGLAQHRAVMRKVGVTEADVRAELDDLRAA